MQRSYHERRGYRETQEQSRVQKPGPGAAKILPPHEEEGAVVPELRGRSLRQGMASSQGYNQPRTLAGRQLWE